MITQTTNLSELEVQLKREILEESYYHYVIWGFRQLFPSEKFEPNFHIEYLCNQFQKEIERIIRKEEKEEDIIANIPPRSSKSLIANVFLNSWAWIKDPTIPFISVSFDEDLSLLNAQYAKDLINSDEFQLLFGHKFQIRRDANSKGYFMNDKGGFRLSKTTGSNITGHKGTVIIVDDPQNPLSAESEVKRKETISYYTNALYNRLTPINLGIRIIIMQRLHKNDLTGYLLANNPQDYRHICLPAELSNEVKPAELKSMYKDGLLDPVRLSAKTLKGFLGTLGTRGYAGQYKQIPSDEKGNIWKSEWFDILEPHMLIRDSRNNPIHIAVDGAYTAKTENDPTGILAYFIKDNTIYIIDFIEVWMEFPELITFLTNYATRIGMNEYSRMLIEPKASGKSIVQTLRTTTSFNVIESTPPTEDKITKANGKAPLLEGRRVKLLNGLYVKNFLEKVQAFPNDHDEVIDCVCIAIDDMNDSGNDFMFL